MSDSDSSVNGGVNGGGAGGVNGMAYSGDVNGGGAGGVNGMANSGDVNGGGDLYNTLTDVVENIVTVLNDRVDVVEDYMVTKEELEDLKRFVATELQHLNVRMNEHASVRMNEHASLFSEMQKVNGKMNELNVRMNGYVSIVQQFIMTMNAHDESHNLLQDQLRMLHGSVEGAVSSINQILVNYPSIGPETEGATGEDVHVGGPHETEGATGEDDVHGGDTEGTTGEDARREPGPSVL